MWMRVPTMVMMSAMVALSGSIANAMSKRAAPIETIGNASECRLRAPSGSAASMMQKITESRAAPQITPIANVCTADLPTRSCSSLPNRPLMTAPTNGKSGISHIGPVSVTLCRTTVSSCMPGLLLQRRGFVGVDGAELAEDREHDGERDGGLGRRQHDDEDREHLAAHPARHVVCERDIVDVGRIEHQLDAHQDRHRVAARRHGEHAEREHDRAQHQKMGEADVK